MPPKGLGSRYFVDGIEGWPDYKWVWGVPVLSLPVSFPLRHFTPIFLSSPLISRPPSPLPVRVNSHPICPMMPPSHPTPFLQSPPLPSLVLNYPIYAEFYIPQTLLQFMFVCTFVYNYQVIRWCQGYIISEHFGNIRLLLIFMS